MIRFWKSLCEVLQKNVKFITKLSTDAFLHDFDKVKTFQLLTKQFTPRV